MELRLEQLCDFTLLTDTLMAVDFYKVSLMEKLSKDKTGTNWSNQIFLLTFVKFLLCQYNIIVYKIQEQKEFTLGMYYAQLYKINISKK
jgi:hypothetical protein